MKLPNVVLTGVMGSGKTTTAPLLAHKLGYELVDTDAVIVERHGPIDELVEEHGRDRFREIEFDLARELRGVTRTVIATGGGLMAQPEAEQELLHGDPKVFWLTATPEELVRRLRAVDNKSPLITSYDPVWNMEWFLRLRASVFDVYERVDTTGRTPKQVAETLRRKFDAHCRARRAS